VAEYQRVFRHVGFFVALAGTFPAPPCGRGIQRTAAARDSENGSFFLSRKGKRTMSTTLDKEYEHLGASRGIEDHDHDLIHELSRRLDCLWRYDQYIANCGDRPDLQEFWRGAKSQDQKNIDQLKKLIKQHVQNNCF